MRHHTRLWLPAAAAALLGCGGAGEAPAPPPGAGASGDLPRSFAGMIVFSRAQDRTNVLMAMNPDGSGLVRLPVQGFRPDVSPDGRRLAYGTPDDGIAVFDLATGRETVLAPRLAVAPRWSPDGTRILFSSDRSGTQELWTMRADGSDPVQLTDGSGGYQEADWSPDGARLVFRRVGRGSGGGDLWTMNADGTDAALLYAGERMDSDPRWSPDGRRIAFIRVVPKEVGGTTSQLFVMDADGSGVRRLTSGDVDVWSPRWSPDGSAILYFAFQAGPDDPDVLSVHPDGGQLAVVVGGPTYDHGAVYGPGR